ncbi:MAG: ASCH domain-containing protein [Steroidobacteraceae bacterium]
MASRATGRARARPWVTSGLLFVVAGAPAIAGAPDACTVRTLGSSEEMFRRLLPLILDGSKTGTFSLGEPPRVGDCVAVTHFDGTPALIWRVTGVEILPFDAIGAAQLALESPGLRELEAWRKVHLRAWAGQLAGKSRAEIGRTPVVVQRFVVIHPVAAPIP